MYIKKSSTLLRVEVYWHGNLYFFFTAVPSPLKFRVASILQQPVFGQTVSQTQKMFAHALLLYDQKPILPLGLKPFLCHVIAFFLTNNEILKQYQNLST